MSQTEVEHDELLGELKPGEKTIKELKYGGYLLLEHDIPYILIYRKEEYDDSTVRLAKVAASYLIIEQRHFKYFNKIVKELTNKMSERFGSFLMIEIYSGEIGSKDFIIRGPSHKLPASIKKIQDELNTISDPIDKKLNPQVKVEQTKYRVNPKYRSFFNIKDIKDCGGTFIGLEIPPLYLNKDKEAYPLYFKKFQESFAKAIQKTVFEFIRVQTNSHLKYYTALGKREIHENLFEIDKELTKIENSYNFLLLIAPVNIQSLRKTFFESGFKKMNSYHYRLLPIDPDIIKRKLYNLPIDQIDDHALAYLFEEKREEIDQELTMLKNRGAEDFFYTGLKLYKRIEKETLSEAKSILKNVEEDKQQNDYKELNAQEFADLAQREFEFFKNQTSDFNSKIHIRDDVNVMMVSNGELYLPSDYTMTKKEASALIQHEVGTHILTYYNGNNQPLTQFSQGLAGYDSLQEGLAVLSEYLINGLTKNRLRILAGRVIAGQALIDQADFKEVFSLLYSKYEFSKEPAFNITSRIFQGGGFLKDIVYLRGLVQLRDYLANDGDFEILLSGKFALEHIPIIKNLMDREIMQSAKIKPWYMQTQSFKRNLKNIRNGIALSKLV